MTRRKGNRMDELATLTDRVAVNRMYRMSLSAAALRYDDRDPSFAHGLREAALVAGALADEAEQVALFYWSQRGVTP